MFLTARTTIITAMLALTLSVSAQEQKKWTATVKQGGEVQLLIGKTEAGRITPGLFEKGWRFATMKGDVRPSSAPGKFSGTIKAPGGGTVSCDITSSIVDKGLKLQYRLTPKQDMMLNNLHVSLNMPMQVVAGQDYKAGDKTGTIPDKYAQAQVHSGSLTTVTLNARDASPITLELASPITVLLQDDRQWGDSLSVRIGEGNGDQTWPAGKSLNITMTLTTPDGMAVEIDEPVTIKEGEDWIPLKLELDIVPGSALDFSGMGQLDAPAGKHGRIIARKDGKLVFKDSPKTPQRFYGVNFCFSAHYITHEQADQLADRLARLGYNTVRFHHYEGELVDKSNGTTTTFLADKLDQIDYLFAALKKRGIYVTTDLFVSRPVFAKEIYPDAPAGERLEMDDIKMAMIINDRALENWKEFSRNFLTHKNQYTGLSLAEDPTLAWLAMINEGNADNFVSRISGRVGKDWQKAWNDWLKERYSSSAELEKAWGKDPGGDPAAGTVLLKGNVYGGSVQDRDLVHFCGVVEARAFDRMRKFLKEELKCEALLTNRSSWCNRISTHACRADYDYVDDHFYVDHPHFIEQSWRLPSRCANTSPIAGGARGGRDKAFTKIFGKPFTVSEYNYSGPGRFRGVGGILTGSMGAIQDWDVIWRFAYSHNRECIIEPRPMDYFNLAGDPLNQAADRATICLYLRGDMKPAPHSVAIAMTPDEGLKNPVKNTALVPDWTALAWITKIGTILSDKPGTVQADIVLPLGWGASSKFKGGTTLDVDPYSAEAGNAILKTMEEKGWLKDNKTDLKKQILQSENGDILIDAERDVMVINTAKTAGGYAPEGETIRTSAVGIKITKTDATVWVSSVDNKPIQQSKRLIVTHLTDLQNSECKFAEKARQTLLSWGKLPHLALNGSAVVAIRLDNAEKAKVYALSTSGQRTGEIMNVQRKSTSLTFPLNVKGSDGAILVYEVVIE